MNEKEKKKTIIDNGSKFLSLNGNSNIKKTKFYISECKPSFMNYFHEKMQVKLSPVNKSYKDN